MEPNKSSLSNGVMGDSAPDRGAIVPKPPPNATPVLHPWDQGSAVMELQELLCAHGFTLRIDGDFGWRTEAAVWAFQRQKGLRMDGIVSSQTWQALRATVEPGTRTLHRGHIGADVRELQGLLQVCGYDVRRDGIFGEKTHQAVVAFQQHHHLHDDGRVCSVTWNILRAGKPVHPPRPRTRWLPDFSRWW